MIAALFVETGGVYFNLPGVEPWDAQRDARKYAGPWPVIAHPPCERWGSFWPGSPVQVSRGIRFQKGDDGGCFASAVAAVQRYGGVIEHPRGSHAWAHFRLGVPHRGGSWARADDFGGWTCEVYQGHYGHKALKPTWLYWRGQGKPPELQWGKPEGEFMTVAGTSFKTVAHRREAEAKGWKYSPRLPTALRNRTPEPFRDLLIGLAAVALPPHPEVGEKR